MGIYTKIADAGGKWVEIGTSSGGGGSAWGDFTTNGDENDSGTYKDGVGREWKWAEWNVANDYSVNLTGGLYHVLAVGGGAHPYNSTGGTNQGQPGLVNEGLWEFQTGTHTVTVGERGKQYTPGNLGLPSSIGDYGTQGATTWGQHETGRGGLSNNDTKGYVSSITGDPLEYAPGYGGTAGRPGTGTMTGVSTDGCVIIATVTNDPSEWNPPGQLPGLGGWATITAVSGVYTKHTYDDWVAYEFTDDGSVTITDGLVDALIVGAGGGGGTGYSGRAGHGGSVIWGVESLTADTHEVRVGATTPPVDGGRPGAASQFGEKYAGTIGSGTGTGGGTPGAGSNTISGGSTLGAAAGSTPGPGLISNITGSPVEYGLGGVAANSAPPTSGPGQGGWAKPGSSLGDGQSGPGSAGVVIIRVPAANAQSVSETRHGWLNFATVENGVVTSVNKTPDNIPYTTAVDEIPCGPEVAEGWNYEGSEFVAPEPDYSEQIKELEEQLKNLRGTL